MKLLMENWRQYVTETEKSSIYGKMDLLEDDAAGSITTIGQLHKYFEEKDPSTLQNLAAKFGGITAKILGGAIGTAATGGIAGALAGAAASSIAEAIVEQMLMASIMAFANIEDGTYPEGSAATYFDLEDNLTLFLRDIESKGSDFTKPTKAEMEVFTIMRSKIQDAIQGDVSPKTTIAQLLGDITSQSVMDAHLKSGEFAGKVKVEPAT